MQIGVMNLDGTDVTTMRSIKQRRGKRSFTLVELMVMIVIIGLLAFVLTPRVSHEVLRADNTYCRNNLRGIYQLLTMYAEMGVSTNRPYPATLGGLLEIGASPKLFICRADAGRSRATHTNSASFTDDNCSYNYATLPSPADTGLSPCYSGPLVYDKEFIRGSTTTRIRHGDASVNVIYGDGSLGYATNSDTATYEAGTKTLVEAAGGVVVGH